MISSPKNEQSNAEKSCFSIVCVSRQKCAQKTRWKTTKKINIWFLDARRNIFYHQNLCVFSVCKAIVICQSLFPFGAIKENQFWTKNSWAKIEPKGRERREKGRKKKKKNGLNKRFGNDLKDGTRWTLVCLCVPAHTNCHQLSDWSLQTGKTI